MAMTLVLWITVTLVLLAVIVILIDERQCERQCSSEIPRLATEMTDAPWSSEIYKFFFLGVCGWFATYGINDWIGLTMREIFLELSPLSFLVAGDLVVFLSIVIMIELWFGKFSIRGKVPLKPAEQTRYRPFVGYTLDGHERAVRGNYPDGHRGSEYD